jgi:hypothetical protein
MKNSKYLLWALPILGFVLAGISMFFLPAQIPLQINISGQFNYGSRYYLFALPAISALFLLKSTNARQPSVWVRVAVPVLLLVVETVVIITSLAA